MLSANQNGEIFSCILLCVKSYVCETRTQRKYYFRLKLNSARFNYHFVTSIQKSHNLIARFFQSKVLGTNLQNSLQNGFLYISYSYNFIGYFKQALKSDRLFSCSVPFSLAGEKERFRAENIAIRELIAFLRASQIARVTSDF